MNDTSNPEPSFLAVLIERINFVEKKLSCIWVTFATFPKLVFNEIVRIEKADWLSTHRMITNWRKSLIEFKRNPVLLIWISQPKLGDTSLKTVTATQACGETFLEVSNYTMRIYHNSMEGYSTNSLLKHGDFPDFNSR